MMMLFVHLLGPCTCLNHMSWLSLPTRGGIVVPVTVHCCTYLSPAGWSASRRCMLQVASCMLRRTAEVNHRYLPAFTNYTVFCRPTALQVGESGTHHWCCCSAVHLAWCPVSAFAEQ